MKTLILGPIVHDTIIQNGNEHTIIGGIPYYSGLALTHLGWEVTIVSTHGDDLPATALNVTRVAASTLHFIVEYDGENRRQFVRGAPQPLTIDDIPSLDVFDVVIIAPLVYENTPKELIERLEHKNIIYGNFGLFSSIVDGQRVLDNPKRALELMHKFRAVFLDQQEALFLTGTDNCDSAATVLQAKGVDLVSITKGSKGSSIYAKKRFDIPAFPARVVDSTGAGDTYMAAYLVAEELFDSVFEKGKFAAMAAAMAVGKKGAFNYSIEEVNSHILK